MNEHLQAELDAAFSHRNDSQLVRGAREGILLADGLMDSEPILKSLVGRDLRGHIRRAGILFRIHDLSTRGDLALEAEMVPMPRGNWHCVEIKSGAFKAHICRTETPGAFPDDTPTRQDARLVNAPDLFSGTVVPFATLATEIKEFYAWLMFGASPNGKLGHLCWGVPSAEGGDWLAHTNVLRRHEAADTEMKPEAPAKNLGLRFKNHIEEALTKDEADKKSED